MNPAAFQASEGLGVRGTTQVGYGMLLGSTEQGAMVWHGTAASGVDLSPIGSTQSAAYGAGGSQQVGYCEGTLTANASHAFLWTGSAASAIDLNPIGDYGSSASDTNGFEQVGYGGGALTNNQSHALMWTGSAISVIDLQSVLPSNFVSSKAYSISGETIYGTATDTSGKLHAIVWVVPEPTSLSIIAFAGLALLRRRNV